MKLTDFVVRDAILCDLQATDRPGAIREIAEAMRDAGVVDEGSLESILQAVLKREQLGSTGIGKGVAIPHTKHGSVTGLSAGVGISRAGVAFAALDGEPVHVLFLVISPEDRPGEHLRALEKISRQLKSPEFCRFLRGAESREAVCELIGEADAGLFG